MKKWIVLTVLGTLVLGACVDNDPITDGPTAVELTNPEGFPSLYIDPDNPITEEGIALGRQLFYDPQLNGTGGNACASCHVQEYGFTTPASNALAHINLGWAKNYLWNGKIQGTLEDIMRFEVEEFFKTDLSVINASEQYRKDFKKAFGVEEITYRELAYALAQFERTMMSADSKYDRFLKEEVSLTPQERRGWIYFYTEKGDCFHCHAGNLFTDNDFHNNGLDSMPEAGRMDISGNALDNGKFKTPTLRNIELTGPYMHDGRFETLEEVVRFYSTGVKRSATIDPLMKQVDGGGVNFTDDEVADMVAFLKTLTDTSFLNRPSLSNPW